MKKGIVIISVALITSFAFIPVINGNFSITSVENKSVNISVEIFKIDGTQDINIQMSEQDALEIDFIFDDMKLKLENVNTKQEVIDIFNEAVVSLNELGLLPVDISVKEVQQLVTNINFKENIMGDDNENFNCFIAGKTKGTFFFKPWWHPMCVGLIVTKPWVNGIIAFGLEDCFDNEHTFYQASGWVWTNGSNGVKTWDSDILWGNLGSHYSVWELSPTMWIEYWYYKGATGFTGISIRGFPYTRYIGIASHVSIVTEFPGKNLQQ